MYTDNCTSKGWNCNSIISNFDKFPTLL